MSISEAENAFGIVIRDVAVICFYMITPEAPFDNVVLSLIPACISNHMPGKVWDKLFIHSQASTVQPLKLGIDN